MKHLLRALGVAACASSLLITSFACGTSPGTGGSGGIAGSGGGNQGGSGGTGGSGGSGGTGGTCTPKQCPDTSECGTYDDSCGGKITCTAQCPCTPTDFSMCPQKPCQTVTGCSDKYACTYAPVTCGAAQCAPQTCTGIGCDTICQDASCTSGLYPCGDHHVCSGVAQYCDPQPMQQQDGSTKFGNACVDPPANVGCGTCDLGLRSCDMTNDVFACQDIPFPTGGSNDCTDLDAHSTFVYVDPTYKGSPNKGTRGRPFVSIADAVAGAKDPSRGGAVRGIIIGGSPTFTDTLVVADGISIFGGYKDYLHDFLPDPVNQRPHWLVSTPTGDVHDNRVVGGIATDIVNPTVLHHLDIKTADLGPNDNYQGFGTSTMGFVAVNAGALQLDDVTITAGRGGDGKPGADGLANPNGNGTDAVGTAPGDSPGCTQPRCPQTPGNYNCGDGGLGVAPANGMAGTAPNGAPGDDPVTLTGGLGGHDASPADSDMCDPLVTQATAGAPGKDGKDGTDNGNKQGTSATRGALDSAGLWKPGIAQPGPTGLRGTWGSGGGAGGGVLNICGGACGGLGCKGGDGGGGGGPGCGGAGGNNGGSGGVSVGLAAVNSSGMKVTGCAIKSSGGGSGALGGKGLPGYVGGKGETANRCDGVANCAPNDGQAAMGGIGGKGGKGGGGGKGGDGAGGDSAAVYCVGSPVTPTGGTQDAGAPGAGAGAGEAGQAAKTIGCG